MSLTGDAGPDTHERCDDCGFDASRWTDQDAVHTIGAAADLVEHALAGAGPEVVARRPDASTWSAVDHVDRLRAVTCAAHLAIATGVEGCATGSGSLPHLTSAATPGGTDVAATVEALNHESSRLAKALLKLGPGDWERDVEVGGQLLTVRRTTRRLCHDLFHRLAQVADIRRTLETSMPVMRGAVSQINASDGGVPKSAIPSAVIGAAGLKGDRQATRRHHGRPWQALCVYSTDVIDALAAEGHPITAGSTGENLTLSGIDWHRLRGGLVVSIGDVRCRLSMPATPCSKTSGSFRDGEHNRMNHADHPGWSRWYASVLAGGTIRTGDAVSVHA